MHEIACAVIVKDVSHKGRMIHTYIVKIHETMRAQYIEQYTYHPLRVRYKLTFCGVGKHDDLRVSAVTVTLNPCAQFVFMICFVFK